MVEHESEHGPERPLSPELVLVSPELRERALREERDEPPPARADDDTPPVAAPEPPAPSPPSPAPPRAEAAAAPVERRRTARALTVLALIALLLFSAGIAVGKLAFPGSTDQAPVTSRSASPSPPVTTRPPARTSSSVPTTTPRATSTARSPTAPRATAPRPPVTTASPARTSSSASTTTPARQPKPSTAPPPAGTPPSSTVRPTPNGGYVFSGGRFRLSGNGRTILSFVLRTTCAGSLTLPAIQVAADGTFTFSGKPREAPPGTTVHVTGRFTSPAAAHGTAQVERRTCHDPARPFAARLS